MRMSNHASKSGYDRLIDFIETEKVFGETEISMFARVLTKGLRPLIKPLIRGSALEWYNRDNFITEFNASKKWLITKGQIFHFLYGENSYRYLGYLKSINKRNSIVCTYHTPPERFRQVVRKYDHLKHIDAIVAVSRMQVDYLSKYTGSERTFYVPHGIDVDYFKPGERDKGQETSVKCLFVGSHLRDVETLVDASILLKSWGKKIEIIAVTAPRNKSIIERSDNIDLRMGISDAELLQLYQQSDMLLLPLLEATANNSLLEAMACGLPIVSTDLEGVRDYVNNEIAILVRKKDPRALAEAVVDLASNNKLREKMSKLCREQALKFSWESVADQMRDIYNIVQP